MFRRKTDKQHKHQSCDHHSHGETASAPTRRSAPIDTSSSQKTELRVEGMDCPDEIAILEKVLLPIDGVHDVRANLMTEKITVFHGESITPQNLTDAIAPTGMKATDSRDSSHSRAVPALAQKDRLIAVGTSGFLTAIGLILQWTTTGLAPFTLVLYIGAIIAGGWFIFPKALAAARRLTPDMNLLMTIAVLGAGLIGEWAEAASVVFLFGLSELLEAFSVNRSRRAIQSLMALAPETAWVTRDNELLEVPAEEVAVGEMLLVRTGARVPLDGVVVSGLSSVDQASITGESMPVEKSPGDDVFAGTINGEGALDIRVSKPASDSTLARIIHLVEEAQNQKAPTQQFVDAFARVYTPIVMVLALLVFLVPPLMLGSGWETWFYRALVLLVIACPCALVISTPVSVVSGLTAMARRGVLIKGGAFIESVGRLRALAVDKTGTITEGRPRVVEIRSFNNTSEETILRLAAAIDVHSSHPAALAIIAHAHERQIDFPRADKYQARSGRGAEAEVDGHRYFVGNHRFTHELAVCSPEIEQILTELEEQGHSIVVVGHKPHDDCKGETLGVLALADTIRLNAISAIQAIHRTGVKHVVMLSGDTQRTVDRIGSQVGIDQAFGDLLPEDKINRIRQLQKEHEYVGMIGDGVNDAPAMAAATIGFAMGAAGTDTAIETADIALMEDDLGKVAETIQMGRRTLRIIQFNITFAIAIKVLFLILAVFGYTTLWLAIAADTGATLLVVANSLRLLRSRPKQQP